MDELNASRDLIERLLTENASIPFSNSTVELETVFDRSQDHYLIMLAGWERGRREHGCLVHVDITDGKFVIQRDGTEYSIARELVDAGVPKDKIVLAYKPLEIRELSGFAVA